MTVGGDAEAGRDWLPDEARLIALVHDAAGADWAAGVAAGLADMVGRRRGRTILANAAGAGGGALDRMLDADGGPGLTSALTGAATVSSIARRPAGQKFVYLPAGDAALPFSGLRRMKAFRRFLVKVRQQGGTLLLYVGEPDLRATGAGEVAGAAARRSAGSVAEDGATLDGCIALGDVRGLAAALGAPLLARVERPAPPPGPSGRPVAPGRARDDAPGGEGARERGEYRAAKRRPGSLVRLALPLAVVGLGFVGWSLLTRNPAGQGPGAAGATPGARAAAADLAGPGDGSDGTGRPAEAAAAGGGDGRGHEARGDGSTPDLRSPGPVHAGGARAVFSAPSAGYSVLVGSYIRLEDAMARRAELAGDGGLFYVSPTPVRGRTYFRVLAGAHEDRADAAVLMAELVADGRKDVLKEWDIRPVRLAYELGTFAERNAADLRARMLRGEGVPAYILRDTAAAPSYRVYAGAFTSAEDAESLGRRLDELEVGAQLVTRSGVAP